MKERKTHWFRTTLLVLIACGIVGLIIAGIQFFGNPDPTTVSAVIQLSYDGAADGRAPNGNRLDMQVIASDQILEKALEAASLQDVYNPAQIRSSLTVRGVYPEDISRQVMNYESLLDFTANRRLSISDFHATTYKVTLRNDFDASVSKARLEELFKQILAAWRTYFANNGVYSLETAGTVFMIDDYDYPQQLEILQGRMRSLQAYAENLYDEDAAFRVNGQGFNDIAVRLVNLRTSDLARLEAQMVINALTKDSARLLTEYQFEIRDLSHQLEKQTERLRNVDALVASYEKNEVIYLSTADSVTKIDGNSSETYDSLVDHRKEVADSITDIKSQIAEYQQKLRDLLGDTIEEENRSDAATVKNEMNAANETVENEGEGLSAAGESEIVTMTEEEIQAAAELAAQQQAARIQAMENDLAVLEAKLNAIIADFSTIIQAKNAEQINDLTVTVSAVKYKAPSVLSGAFIKELVMTAGPVCAIGFVVCMVLVFASRRKEALEFEKK